LFYALHTAWHSLTSVYILIMVYHGQAVVAFSLVCH